jgi:WD40 repeat protein
LRNTLSDSLTIDAHDRDGLPLAVSTGGQRLATGGFDGTLVLRSLPSGDNLATAEGPEQRLNDGARTAGGALLTAVTDETPGAWDLADRSARDRLEGHTGTVARVDAVWTLESDGRLRRWSPEDWTATTGMEVDGRSTGLAVRPDGGALAVTVQGGASVRDADGTVSVSG